MLSNVSIHSPAEENSPVRVKHRNRFVHSGNDGEGLSSAGKPLHFDLYVAYRDVFKVHANVAECRRSPSRSVSLLRQVRQNGHNV